MCAATNGCVLYCKACANTWIRLRVASATSGLFRSANDTVEVETFARKATSRMVGATDFIERCEIQSPSAVNDAPVQYYSNSLPAPNPAPEDSALREVIVLVAA